VALLASAIVASVWLGLARQREPEERVRADETLLAQRSDDQSGQTVTPDTVRSAMQPGDLEAMSESFRNTSFLVAIREAGFFCDAVVSGYRSGERTWIASCRDLRGYNIDASEPGVLAVEPIPHYFDSVAPVVPNLNDRFRLDVEPRIEPRPPQRFRR
jgi:hypothetical protein